MPRAQVPSSKVQAVLRSVAQHQKLVLMIRKMALEIERLEEDNHQLRVAVKMYREALSRYAPRN